MAQPTPSTGIPEDRCQRCGAELGETWNAYQDRVCGVCAHRAHGRDEDVARVDPEPRPDCPHCHGLPLEPVRLPDRQLIAGRCGVCSPLPASADLEELT